MAGLDSLPAAEAHTSFVIASRNRRAGLTVTIQHLLDTTACPVAAHAGGCPA